MIGPQGHVLKIVLMRSIYALATIFKFTEGGTLATLLSKRARHTLQGVATEVFASNLLLVAFCMVRYASINQILMLLCQVVATATFAANPGHSLAIQIIARADF